MATTRRGAAASEERGEFRGIYVALIDDPDFQLLGAYARWTFMVLKLNLGKAGIGVCYPGSLVDPIGIPLEMVSSAIDELFHGGWIAVERNVVWIRNGLRFEPSLSLNNDNHRASIEKHIRGLPKLGIVNDYAEYYGLSVPYPDLVRATHRDPIEIPSRSHADPIPDHGIRNTEDRLTTTGDKSPEAPPHELHPVEEPDAEPEEADAPPLEQPDPKVVPLRKAEPTLNEYRGQAVTLILEKLWLNTRDNPPRRFGREWSLANELSIWKALVEHEAPEDVNGAIGHMRRVGDFRADEPLSLKLFHSKDPNSRTLYAACLQAYRREMERDAARLQMQMGGIIDQVMARRNVSA